MKIKIDIHGSYISFGEELKDTKNITQSGHIWTLNEFITSIFSVINFFLGRFICHWPLNTINPNSVFYG